MLELVEIPMQASVLDDYKSLQKPAVVHSSSTVVHVTSFLCSLVETWI